MNNNAPDETVPDLYRLAFIPGCFRCPKCDFALTKTTLCATTGSIGTHEKDRESEPCPNDGTMMVHVTYREMLQAHSDTLMQQYERVDELTAAETLWRKMLWLHHGCTGLYGDDGEMQCSRCMIDFRRDSAASIEAAFERIKLRRMSEWRGK